MQEFEKLGVFYLGRPYDLAKKKPKKGWLLYDSKDLVTHAVCVGMTGSGKTGLCLGLLEEAAIDGIPAVVIDPKGDLANLLLTFPELRGEDFAPWINEDDARRKGLSPADYAEQEAAKWKKGLADWGQDGARIARLKAAADFAIYTPGSSAGIPLSILRAFSAPPSETIEDSERLREKVNATVTGLLGLVGLSADPIKSPPHILVSAILEAVWRKGQDLDLVSLIQQIQTPPFSRMGALDVESFYPANDPTDNPSKGRFSLVKRLNNLIASPGFAVWMEGEPLDMGSMLYTPEGKPKISILSIAHLNDQERMFFVTLLLSQVLSWMRVQSGTTSLRAILYMDEIFGYFPPIANPPSKAPLLTLLKQARAFGLGVVLATQNPVDLDYKGLANAGTWFIGRLQTERDKARVMEGLEGVMLGAGSKFDKARMEQVLAGLGSRVFLMNNVHDDAPEIFESRWTLSYLRGPLTRTLIKALMSTRRAVSAGATARGEEKSFGDQPALQTSRPMLSPGVPQYFVPVRSSPPQGSALVYQPRLLAAGQVHVTDAKAGVDVRRNLLVLAAMSDGPVPVKWDEAVETALAVSDLGQAPESDAQFAALPAVAGQAKNYAGWSKDFAAWLYRSQAVTVWKSARLKEISRPEESERDFRIRLQQVAHERRDEATERLRRKYAPKLASLQERRRRAEQAVAREKEQANQSKVQAVISVGATLLQAFMGRKAVSASTIGRATTAIRGAGRVIKDAKDVGLAEDNAAAIDRQIAELEAQFQSEVEKLAASLEAQEPLDRLTLRPAKGQITVTLVALAWLPYWRDAQDLLTEAF